MTGATGSELYDSIDPSSKDILHASCVAYAGHAVLILGASGQGKSALSLDLMSRGATLVSDDRVLLYLSQGKLWADAPKAIQGRIEARGVGILNAEASGPCPVSLVVDLNEKEVDRLPKHYTFSRFGVTVPLLFRVPYPHFAPALLQFLSQGRSLE